MDRLKGIERNSSFRWIDGRNSGKSEQVFSNERKASSERSSKWRLPLVAPVHSVRS